MSVAAPLRPLPLPSIVEPGAPEGPIFAALPETDIGQVYRGDTVRLPTWEARDYYGLIIDLTGGSVWFTAKVDLTLMDGDPTTIQCSTTAGSITIVDPVLGTYQVTIGPAATQALLDDTVYTFDVQVRTGTLDPETITVKRGIMTVLQDVTRLVA